MFLSASVCLITVHLCISVYFRDIKAYFLVGSTCSILMQPEPNMAVEWLALLFCILDVPDSIISLDASCHEVYLDYFQSFQLDSGLVLQVI